MIQGARIQIFDLSITQANVYEGRGSSQALHRVVDRDGRSGLWKEYKQDVAASIDAELLTELVQWPSTLTGRERERLLPFLAHPRAVVTRSPGWCCRRRLRTSPTAIVAAGSDLGPSTR